MKGFCLNNPIPQNPENNPMLKHFMFHCTALLLLCAALPCAQGQEIAVDNDDGAPSFTTTGAWTLSGSTGWNGTTYIFTDDTQVLSSATWRPTFPAAGTYEVFAAFLRSTNRPTAAPFTITHAGGSDTVQLNQNGSISQIEVSLGVYDFTAGTAGSVTIANNGSTGYYIADAILFRPATPAGPNITSLSRNTKYVFDNNAPGIAATITPFGTTTIAAATAQVTVQPSATVLNLTMLDGAHGDGAAGDGVYGVTIPAQPGGSTVSVIVSATDNLGRSSSSLPEEYDVTAQPTAEYRCIWADSWGTSFLNATQAADLVNQCRAANINTIIIEVRKIGDAYYSSALEPRATNISGGASYDPLATLIALAHDTSGGKKRVEVHGWFVMHRISRGETLAPNHVLAQHPEYLMTRNDGTTQAGVSFLDPGHPGVPDHNVAVLMDCLSKYDIDGINLDYIRYPEYTGSWGYNPVSVARFNTLNSTTGIPSGTDPAWGDWRRECVSLAVKKGYVKAWQMKPHVIYTACTVNWGNSISDALWPTSSAYAGVFQDWVGWLEDGIIDYNALMNYTSLSSQTRYEGWANLSLDHDSKRGTIVGPGVYLHTNLAGSMDQLLWARHAGGNLNIYDWGSEVNANTEGASRANFYSTLRAQVYPTWVDPPKPAWKYAPTTGIFEGVVTGSNGLPVDHATVEIVDLPGSATVTDGSGWYAIMDVPPGNQVLKASKSALPDRTKSASIPAAGDVVTVNLTWDTSDVTEWAAH
jgi:uncharacterized lipoprotein YddW (UPF0748 family)